MQNPDSKLANGLMLVGERLIASGINSPLRNRYSTRIFLQALPRPLLALPNWLKRTSFANTTGLAVALLAIHRGAKRRYIIAVLVALRPVNTACMAEQNHASERGAVIRMLRVGRGSQLHTRQRNLDAGKDIVRPSMSSASSSLLKSESPISGSFKVQRFVGGHGGGGCGISVHHRHKKSSCVWGSVRRLPC